MMKHRKMLALAAAGALAGGQAAGALAYTAGKLIARAGVASVQPNEDSDELAVDGTPTPRTGAGLDNDEQLGLTLTYRSNCGKRMTSGGRSRADQKAGTRYALSR